MRPAGPSSQQEKIKTSYACAYHRIVGVELKYQNVNTFSFRHFLCQTYTVQMQAHWLQMPTTEIIQDNWHVSRCRIAHKTALNYLCKGGFKKKLCVCHTNHWWLLVGQTQTMTLTVWYHHHQMMDWHPFVKPWPKGVEYFHFLNDWWLVITNGIHARSVKKKRYWTFRYDALRPALLLTLVPLLKCAYW